MQISSLTSRHMGKVVNKMKQSQLLLENLNKALSEFAKFSCF